VPPDPEKPLGAAGRGGADGLGVPIGLAGREAKPPMPAEDGAAGEDIGLGAGDGAE
jgi:hypothetical protein